MDMTPPLTRSPVSTPRTYCPSEASCSGYPSPNLLEPRCSVSSKHKAEPPCSMASAQSPGTSSPQLESIAHLKWSPASVQHPALSSASMDTLLSRPFDTFTPCEDAHSLTTSYSQDVYSTRGQSLSEAAALPTSRSSISSLARLPMQYPSLAGSSPSTPRLKTEDMGSEYGHSHGLETFRYPSPSMESASYPPGGTSNSALPPLATPNLEAPPSCNSAYADASWARLGQFPSGPDRFHAGEISLQSHAMLYMNPTKQRTRSRSREHRRGQPQRKLTTKEDANFQCEFEGCGQLFSRKYNYKAHKETHDKKREYPFPCVVHDCTKKFVRKTDLQRHNHSVHMKERNHVCDYCGRPFARKDTLKRLGIFPIP